MQTQGYVGDIQYLNEEKKILMIKHFLLIIL